MFATQATLAATQFTRNSLEEIAESKHPFREISLEGFRRRNAILDAWFYDIGTVTPDEAAKLSPWLAREGAILIVHPSGGPMELCGNIDAFRKAGGEHVRLLTVAGVGSSALGSAAFARNVADAFEQPTAAVVSGYGLADLASEASGGWFLFRTLNSLRHNLEHFDAIAGPQHTQAPYTSIGTVGQYVHRLSLDTRTVYELLSDKRFKFSLIAGHSKGNLVISEALFQLETLAHPGAHQPDPETFIVTVSAAIHMPSRYTRIVDVIGDVDWFGRINSQRDVDIEERCRLAWHHTNTDIPFHLPVTKTFRKLATDGTLDPAM
ncbi:MAG: hypothetical protein ACK5JT_08255 [Hyphomicrobiaceae bacterium]